jgi:hypothetical protein
MDESLKYDLVKPKTMNKKLFLLPALAAAIIVFFSFGTASSTSNLPKSDIALVYAQTDNSNNNNSTDSQKANIDELKSTKAHKDNPTQIQCPIGRTC